jgi:Superinfection immunity protein
MEGLPVITALLAAAALCTLAAASAALYLLPLLIGAARRAPDLGAVAVINIALGWTLAGWIIALALALRSPAPPPVQVTQVFPVPPPGPPPLILPPRPGRPGPDGRP